jgi:hypothetical protein
MLLGWVLVGFKAAAEVCKDWPREGNYFKLNNCALESRWSIKIEMIDSISF